MDKKKIIVRYGEIFLKGKNRKTFEDKLISNIKKITHATKIKRIQGRLVLDHFEDHISLRNVFGIISYSTALRTEKNERAIQETILELLQGKKGTFKVDTKRSDKTFPIKSPELNRKAGTFIEKNAELEFSFENPDFVIHIEINQDGAYIFTEIIHCFGGLPTGVEGEVRILVENDASILAGLLFMKRGCAVIPVILNDMDISLLQKFSPDTLNTKKEVSEGTLVSGQTLDSYQKYNYPSLVLRPLIGYHDNEIKEELGRYSISHPL